MKGLFVHDHFFIEKDEVIYTSGTLNYATLSRYLSNVSHLTVAARKRGVESKIGEMASGANISFYLFKEFNSVKDYVLNFNKVKRSLYNLVSEADLIIIRLPSFLGLIACSICKKLNKKYVIEVVGCIKDAMFNYGGLLPKMMALPLFYLNRRAIGNSKNVIYVTKYFLQQRYPTFGRSINISNVEIDLNVDDVLTRRLDQIFNTFRHNIEPLRVCIIGNLELKYKGFEEAFKALQLIKKKGFKFMLYIIGGGKSDYIRKLIKQYNLDINVEIVGKLSPSSVVDFLKITDLYLHPSLTEGLPRTVIEAMSVGCPVLASSAGGIPELIEDTYLHKPHDFNTLASNLEKYINLNSFKKMSEANFKTSKEYSRDKLNAKRKAFLEEIINNK